MVSRIGKINEEKTFVSSVTANEFSNFFISSGRLPIKFPMPIDGSKILPLLKSIPERVE